MELDDDALDALGFELESEPGPAQSLVTELDDDDLLVEDSTRLPTVPLRAPANDQPEPRPAAPPPAVHTELAPAEPRQPRASTPAVRAQATPAKPDATAVIEDDTETDWAEAIASAKAAPAASSPTSAPRERRGPSDAMRAVEALSTVEPATFRAHDPDAYAGETFAGGDIGIAGRPRFTPARIGLASAAFSAVIIAAVHLVTASSASAQPEVASEAPVKIVHAAAAFNEAAPEAATQPDQSKGDYAVVDTVRARKLGSLGLRALNQGRVAGAKRMLEQALAANPQSRLALEGLGRIALERKNYGVAIKHLEQAVKIEPRRADNRRHLGDAYAGKGRLRRARNQYTRAAQYGDADAQQRLDALDN